MVNMCIRPSNLFRSISPDPIRDYLINCKLPVSVYKTNVDLGH